MELSNRKFGLDVIRFTAIVLVLLSHTIYLLPLNYGAKSFIFHYFGFLGVELFFVLSGFLIGTILIKSIENSKVITPKLIFIFWVKRWLRTLPIYYLILILNWFVVLQLPVPVFDYFIFTQNFSTPHPSFFGEVWSLSIEECFYLLFPIILAFQFYVFHNFLKFKKRRVFIFSVFLLITTGAVFRCFEEVSSFSEWDSNLRKIVIFRMDSIVYGVFVAYLHFYFKSFTFRIKNWCFLIGISGIVFQTFLFKFHVFEFPNSFYSRVLFFPLFSVFICFIIPFMFYYESNKFIKINIWVTRISLWSYSIYLIHQTLVIFLINKFFIIHGFSENILNLVKFILIWLMSIWLSYLMYSFIEKPILDKRDMFFN